MTKRYFHFPLDDGDPVQIFSAFAKEPFSIFFDSSDPEHPLSRYSYICVYPVETITSFADKVTISHDEDEMTISGNPFDVLQKRLEIYAPEQDSAREFNGHHNGMHPFRGGAAGYFGYDLGRTLEQIPVRADRLEGIPDMAVGIYTSVLAFNHKTGKNTLYILEENESAAEALAGKILKKIRNHKNENQDRVVKAGPEMKPALSAKKFKEKIQAVIDYIFAGDIFQANISLPFRGIVEDDFDLYSQYQKLRKTNKAPYSSYLNTGGVKVASLSPESFLSCINGQVKTRPIKGTCPRKSDPKENQKAVEKLQNDEKCRAENAMIVDLLRNDLSRVCSDYSIKVLSLCEVESYAKVNHMVSTVSGKLRPDKTETDLLKVCFPGGSITGAPKIRAMEIIEELEPERRGPYCGSIGMIGFDGNLETNIAIRTLIQSGETLRLNVGSGIVADSSAEDEYEEIMAKAEGILKSLQSYDCIPGKGENDNEQNESLVAKGRISK